MRSILKPAAVLATCALLAVTLSVASGCGCVIDTYMTPKQATVAPFGDVGFQVWEKAPVDNNASPAPGTWKWSGPGADGKTGSFLAWKAPGTPGTYKITVTGATGAKAYSFTSTVIVKEGAAQGVQEQSAEKPVAPEAAPVTVLEICNTLGIRQGGTAPSFKLAKPAKLAVISTYHYMDAGLPASGTLGLRDASGKVYGPWKTTGVDGQGGKKNAFWQARPDNQLLPAGTYTVIDSDPGTWSTNDQAGGVGFTTVQVTYP